MSTDNLPPLSEHPSAKPEPGQGVFKRGEAPLSIPSLMSHWLAIFKIMVYT